MQKPLPFLPMFLSPEADSQESGARCSKTLVLSL